MIVLSLLVGLLGSVLLMTATGLAVIDIPPHLQAEAARVMPDAKDPIRVFVVGLATTGTVLLLAAIALWRVQ